VLSPKSNGLPWKPFKADYPVRDWWISLAYPLITISEGEMATFDKAKRIRQMTIPQWKAAF
jgi:hypothetical protein